MPDGSVTIPRAKTIPLDVPEYAANSDAFRLALSDYVTEAATEAATEPKRRSWWWLWLIAAGLVLNESA